MSHDKPRPAEVTDTPTSEDKAPPPLAETVQAVVKRLAWRGRRGIERAAEAGRERLERRQAQRDLDHFWTRLGKTAYRLVESGDIDHPALRQAMERIDALTERLEAAKDDGEGTG